MATATPPIAAALAAVRARISAAEVRFGRTPGSVELLAVSKTHPATAISAAFAAGQRAFGENYVQEALTKQDQLPGPLRAAIQWHYIGRIQGNKTPEIAARFDWVHGLSDLRHAERLGAQRPAGQAVLNCCVQVNLSVEASKGGLAPEAVAGFLAGCREIAGIRIAGLMTLPPMAEDIAAQRRPFAALRALRDALATADLPLATLSMGMSDDLEAAIAEGATIVRVGTAIFGARA